MPIRIDAEWTSIGIAVLNWLMVDVLVTMSDQQIV
jgi:hypothetical protein